MEQLFKAMEQVFKTQFQGSLLANTSDIAGGVMCIRSQQVESTRSKGLSSQEDMNTQT